jgi:hypothetical protein
MKIVTEYQGSWIDNRGRRHTEWLAYDDDSYDGPDSSMGSGATEAEAVEWLRELLGERGRLFPDLAAAIDEHLKALEADMARDDAVDRQP